MINREFVRLKFPLSLWLSLVIFSKPVLSKGKETRRLQTLQIDKAWSKNGNGIKLTFRMLNQYFFAA